jgi:hypothetical protein
VKRIITLLAVIQAGCLTGSSQNASWKNSLMSIPTRADLNVRWDAPLDAMPSRVGVYRDLPNKFSGETIASVMSQCSFTAQDKKETTDGLSFQAPNGSRKLLISFPSGEIHYEIKPPRYGPTNLAQGVPLMAEVPKLAEDFLGKMGISMLEITNPFVDGLNMQGTPKFHLSEPLQIYFVGKAQITNIEYRTASYWRLVDRIPVFVGEGGQVSFGEHRRIRGFSITWPTLQCDKWYSTLTPTMMIESIRAGKAVQGLLPMDSPGINWRTVKVLIVKKASPRYYAESGGNSSPGRLVPFTALDSQVDTGHGMIPVEIHCPIIDESAQ